MPIIETLTGLVLCVVNFIAGGMISVARVYREPFHTDGDLWGTILEMGGTFIKLGAIASAIILIVPVSNTIAFVIIGISLLFILFTILVNLATRMRR